MKLRHLLLLALPVLVLSAKEGPLPLAMQQADTLMSSRYAADQPGAAVLVARDGKVILRKGYGLASMELQTPIKPEMVFRIGSVTKQFTAAATLLLVEEGKLDLQAPVSRYFEKAPPSWEGITLRMLLNHTSGIPAYTADPNYVKRFREDFTPASLMETYVLSKPLDFPPGTQYKYNNSGYFLLGMIIEKVSGQPWDQFLKARIFTPLGMKHTRLGTETDLIPGLVSGYGSVSGPDSPKRPAPYLSMTQPGAAGALVSTVDDLATWSLALHGQKVLKPESYKLMVNDTQLPEGKVEAYGFGLSFRQSHHGARLVGHGGGINGFSSYLEMDPESRTLVIILNNSSPKGSNAEYARKLFAIAAGRPISEPKEVPVDLAAFDACAGEYELAPGAFIKVWREGSKLLTQAPGQDPIPLFPEGPTTYFMKVVEAKLVFTLGADGKAEAVVLHQGGRQKAAKRVK